jgi:hypothetical protein
MKTGRGSLLPMQMLCVRYLRGTCQRGKGYKKNCHWSHARTLVGAGARDTNRGGGTLPLEEIPLGEAEALVLTGDAAHRVAWVLCDGVVIWDRDVRQAPYCWGGGVV